MSAAREPIVDALFTLLSGLAEFQTTSRRNPGVEALPQAQTPALFLLEPDETYERKSPSIPATRKLHVAAIFYTDVGDDSNAFPSTQINTILDALDVALQPDNRTTNLCTLGGLVHSVVIEGKVEKAPGETTGKSLAVVPITIVVP